MRRAASRSPVTGRSNSPRSNRLLAALPKTTRFRRSSEAAFSGRPSTANLRQNLRCIPSRFFGTFASHLSNKRGEAIERSHISWIVRRSCKEHRRDRHQDNREPPTESQEPCCWNNRTKFPCWRGFPKPRVYLASQGFSPVRLLRYKDAGFRLGCRESAIGILGLHCPYPQHVRTRWPARTSARNEAGPGHERRPLPRILPDGPRSPRGRCRSHTSRSTTTPSSERAHSCTSQIAFRNDRTCPYRALPYPCRTPSRNDRPPPKTLLRLLCHWTRLWIAFHGNFWYGIR